MISKEELGERIKKAMVMRGLTQKDLAEESNLSATKISNYITGKNFPPVDILAVIAKSLNVSTDWLLGLETHGENSNIVVHSLGDIVKMLFEIDKVEHIEIRCDNSDCYYFAFYRDILQELFKEWVKIDSLSLEGDVVESALLPAWRDKWVRDLSEYVYDPEKKDFFNSKGDNGRDDLPF